MHLSCVDTFMYTGKQDGRGKKCLLFVNVFYIVPRELFTFFCVKVKQVFLWVISTHPADTLTQHQTFCMY